MGKAKTYRLELILDGDDWRDVQAEIARYQARNRWPASEGGGVIIPDGDSNLPGAIIGEAIRALNEYRDLYDAEHTPEGGAA